MEHLGGIIFIKHILREVQPYNSTTNGRNMAKHVKWLCLAHFDMLCLSHGPHVAWGAAFSCYQYQPQVHSLWFMVHSPVNHHPHRYHVLVVLILLMIWCWQFRFFLDLLIVVPEVDLSLSLSLYLCMCSCLDISGSVYAGGVTFGTVQIHWFLCGQLANVFSKTWSEGET